MTQLKSSVGRTVKEYVLLTLGLFCYVMGWCVFLIPNNLVGGGVSGISAIVHYATKGAIGVGTTYFIINAVLLVIAFKVLGFGFGGKTIYAVLVASALLNYLPSFIPEQFVQEFALNNGKFLCTILGGAMSGVGIGLTFSQGGSTGGTDIIALIVTKYKPISPGKVILFLDVIIILSVLICPSYDAAGVLVPFLGRIATAAYGFILVAVNSYVLDLYIAGSKQSVQVFIFSSQYEKIADAIAYDLKRGVTIIKSEGWYTKTERNIVLVMTRKNDLNLLLRYVKTIDPGAFLSVSSVMGVYGKGFDTIKVKSGKS